MRRITALLLIGVLNTCALAAETPAANSPQWSFTGDAAQDPSRDHTGGDGSLKIAPGAKATFKPRESDGSGKVEFWVYDNMTKPADPKERRVGPRWGLLQSNGRVLVSGVLYAPYLDGASTYATVSSDGKSWFDSIQYSAVKRSEGWHKWTFDFNAANGLNILVDGKKARFNWNTANINGFAGVVLIGDTNSAGAQTFWVDDVTIDLGGPVTAKPAASDSAPTPQAAPAKSNSRIPAQDPAPTREVKLVTALAGKHPRLLFTADDIPALRAKAEGLGKPFYDQLMQYLPASTPPKEAKFLTDATDAQRHGLWRLPTLSLHYAITGDAKSRDTIIAYLKFLASLENWETGQELDSGMAAANIMIGAALGYDCVYNDLDPAFRDTMGKKLLLHARRMYHGGHLMQNPGQHYWQSDPHNNHRWHRNAGLALCVLAVAGEQPGTEWLMEKTKEELEFIAKWLPKDGSSHESSSYLVFGGPHLALAFQAADRCLGTDLLSHEFFKRTPAFRLATLQPGFADAFHYGDSGGTGGINSYNFLAAARSGKADLHAGIMDFYRATPKAFEFGWASLLWFDPALSDGSLANVAKRDYFEDMGIASLRDGWDKDSVALFFKCAPYGGKTLNEYRNANDFKYINVAHDDPDANMFVLYANGAVLADDDRYATRKITSSHNTILVNGKGQKGEGGHWTQPLKGADQDMLNLATVTAYKSEGEVAVVEGEAGKMYAGLDRYRRTMIWVEGGYILMLDDIASTPGRDAQYTWLLQGPTVSIADASAGQFRLTSGDALCNFTVLVDQPFSAKVAPSTAAHRNKSMDLQQLQLTATAPRWRLATLFDPWQRQVKLSTAASGDGITVRVEGPNINDTWQWNPPPAKDQPSALKGDRAGGWSFSL